MKKSLLIAAALLLAGALNVLRAQDGTQYPQFLYTQYSYTLDGVDRSVVTSAMIKRIVELEASRNDSLEATAKRWVNVPRGYGYYDSIAHYVYKDHNAILADAARLDSGAYKESLWSLTMQRYATSQTDTLVVFNFSYSTDDYLTFYNKTDTSYVAYAGHPYMLQTVSNPLKLPVTYTSSNEAVAKVEKDGKINVAGVGETVITAAFPGNEDFKACSAEWKLVVKDGDYHDLSLMVVIYDQARNWYHPEWIAVTEDNCNDIYGNGQLSYDFKTRTLTMNNFQWELTEEQDMSLGWSDWLDYGSRVKCPLPLAINVKGDCFLKHNSAGIFTDGDLIIYGDKSNSRLALEGRFPQIRANKLTIDGCKVYTKGSTPHPLNLFETLRVENDSYFEAFIDTSQFGMDPTDDPREYGAMAAQIEYLEMGDKIEMLTKGVHIEDGIFVDSDGRASLHVQIGPKTGGGGAAINGDVNGDRVIDVADIASVISVMAKGGNDKTADVNKDGIVDVADIATVITIMASSGNY